MKKDKSAYKRQILIANSGVDHISLDAYHKGLVTPSLGNNLSQTPPYEVYCQSKTFGTIKLKKISYEGITSKEITDFFRYFDFVDTVSLYTDTPFYIDDNSLFSFTLSQKEYEIPVHLFWECLPQEIRNKFKL